MGVKAQHGSETDLRLLFQLVRSVGKGCPLFFLEGWGERSGLRKCTCSFEWPSWDGVGAGSGTRREVCALRGQVAILSI